MPIGPITAIQLGPQFPPVFDPLTSPLKETVGCDVDPYTLNGQTPLMWACLQGHLQLARFLIDRGADVRKKDSLGATALLLTIQHRDLECFLLLLHRDPQCVEDAGVVRCEGEVGFGVHCTVGGENGCSLSGRFWSVETACLLYRGTRGRRLVQFSSLGLRV